MQISISANFFMVFDEFKSVRPQIVIGCEM